MPSAEMQPEPDGSVPPGPLVISIQSQVVHGHVGNSAAAFPMQALGVAVAAVPTTLLSNHPVYPTLRGRVLEAELVEELLRGVEERGLVDAAAVLLTGYLGSAANAAVVAAFAARAKARNPQLLYVCDPVIGDQRAGVFVAAGIVDVFRDRLVPAASILTPNQFEMELLAGAPIRAASAIQRAAARLGPRGGPRLVVTGCALDDTPAGQIETIVCAGAELLRIAAERLALNPFGSGDLFAGLLAAHIALGATLADAARAAAASVETVLRRTLAEGAYELRMLASDFTAPVA